MSTPLHRAAAFGVALSIGSVGLAACGDDSDSGGSGGGGGGNTDVTAACSLDNPPTSAASDAGRARREGVRQGRRHPSRHHVVDALRSSTTSQLLEKALTDAGITADVQNAQGDKNKFASIAQSMIGDGDKVLIIDSIDAASGAGVEALADAAGVKVIDYDRVNLGGTAPYYVSFDNEDVGKLQAQTLVDCLDAQGVDKPKIIMMNGGTDVDNNAAAVPEGRPRGLRPAGRSRATWRSPRKPRSRAGRPRTPPRHSPRRSPRPVATSRASSPRTTTSPTPSSVC